MDVQGRFDQEMLRIYQEAAKFGYRPTRFLEMVNSSVVWLQPTGTVVRAFDLSSVTIAQFYAPSCPGNSVPLKV